MSNKYYLKEFEKKKGIAHPEYVSYIFALSWLDNSRKEFKKALKGYCAFFTEIKSLSKQSKLEISVGKAWHSVRLASESVDLGKLWKWCRENKEDNFVLHLADGTNWECEDSYISVKDLIEWAEKEAKKEKGA